MKKTHICSTKSEKFTVKKNKYSKRNQQKNPKTSSGKQVKKNVFRIIQIISIYSTVKCDTKIADLYSNSVGN